MSCANIENLVSPWDLIASGSIYSWKKCIEESFMMVIKVNGYIKWFLRYQRFSIWWLDDHWLIVWKVFLRAFGGHLDHQNQSSIPRVIVQMKFVTPSLKILKSVHGNSVLELMLQLLLRNGNLQVQKRSIRTFSTNMAFTGHLFINYFTIILYSTLYLELCTIRWKVFFNIILEFIVALALQIGHYTRNQIVSLMIFIVMKKL